ncbi:MAG: YeeE/YedE thiosulfate transporter family protein [Nibricoccus sp.]
MLSLESSLHALGGGTLIGAASLVASAATGKIPGISGVFGKLLRGVRGDALWRAIFLSGLIAGAGAAFYLSSYASDFRPVRSTALLAVAGVLVGFGTRLGGGCTSGHGVCGVGLGAKDSILATAVFVAVGMLTVFVCKYFAGGVLP